MASSAWSLDQQVVALSLVFDRADTLGNLPSKAHRSGFDLATIYDDVSDARERFQLWTSSLGAARPQDDPRSLLHRLRNAPMVQRRITEILHELQDLLSQLDDTGQDDGIVDREADSEDEELLAELRQMSTSREAQCTWVLRSICDAVTRLFQMARLMSRSTATDRYARAQASKHETFSDQVDVLRVQDKFRDGKIDGWLIMRLGKANASRRQYFKYCREHLERISKGQSGLRSDNGAFQKNMTNSLRIPLKVQIGASLATEERSDALTKATTVVATLADEPENAFDEVSISSRATSIGGDQAIDKLEFPRLSSLIGDDFAGTDFDCPYCHHTQRFNGQCGFRKHVKKDLRPYICTFEACGLLMFTSKHAWTEHEMQQHRRCWLCPHRACGTRQYTSRGALASRLLSAHANIHSVDELNLILDTSSRPFEEIRARDCPFCDWESELRSYNLHIEPHAPVTVSAAKFMRHLAGHLEQVALFALPRRLADVESSVLAECDDKGSEVLSSGDADVCAFDTLPALAVLGWFGVCVVRWRRARMKSRLQPQQGTRPLPCPQEIVQIASIATQQPQQDIGVIPFWGGVRGPAMATIDSYGLDVESDISDLDEISSPVLAPTHPGLSAEGNRESTRATQVINPWQRDAATIANDAETIWAGLRNSTAEHCSDAETEDLSADISDHELPSPIAAQHVAARGDDEDDLDAQLSQHMFSTEDFAHEASESEESVDAQTDTHFGETFIIPGPVDSEQSARDYQSRQLCEPDLPTRVSRARQSRGIIGREAVAALQKSLASYQPAKQSDSTNPSTDSFLVCRRDGCPQATEGRFLSKAERDRHEAKHNPTIPCEWPNCNKLFSRKDNMKDHVRRIHKRQANMSPPEPAVRMKLSNSRAEMSLPARADSVEGNNTDPLKAAIPPHLSLWTRFACTFNQCNTTHAIVHDARTHCQRVHGLAFKDTEQFVVEMKEGGTFPEADLLLMGTTNAEHSPAGLGGKGSATHTRDSSQQRMPGASISSSHPHAISPASAEVTLRIEGELESMADDWAPEEWEAKRRLVQFRRSQSGIEITATFESVQPENIILDSDTFRVSCIWWEEKQECYITSVDIISLLEKLVAARFTVEEKNRIRKSLEGARPITVSKAVNNTEDFWRLIMSFAHTKPRTIEGPLKVYPWRILATMLKKVVGKYSASTGK